MRPPARNGPAPHRRSSIAPSVVAVLWAVAAPAWGLAAQVQPLEAGRPYAEGSQVGAPLAGVSLTIPAGYTAQWDGDLGALGMQSGEALGAVWGWSEGGLEEVAEEVGARLEATGLRVSLRGELRELPDGALGTFDARSAEGAGVLVAAIRQGPEGNIVAIAALAGPEGEPTATSFVETVGASLRWSVPGARSWRGEVEGSVLRWSSSGSDMSTGTTTATGASQSEATLAFCYGAYRYAESSESYVSIDGVSASNSSSDGHEGAWYLVADLIGTPTLYLESTDGRAFAWSVEEAADGYLIDGYLYRTAGGC